MILKPHERAWLYDQRHALYGALYGALSMLLPSAVVFALMIGFTVN